MAAGKRKQGQALEEDTMYKIWRQKWTKHQKDGMGRELLGHRRRGKKQVKMTMARLGSLQIQLNRETMRMESVK